MVDLIGNHNILKQQFKIFQPVKKIWIHRYGQMDKPTLISTIIWEDIMAYLMLLKSG